MSNLNTALHAPAPTILAQAHALSCDTRQTGLNNNMLVIGPSGAGKTRNVLKPNLLQMNASYIVLDTKGTLCREVGPVLAAHGYRVQRLNTLPNRSSALGSKTIRSTGSCPRRSEAMRRPSSRRRALAARDALAKILKGRAPRDHGKAKGPASDGIRAPGYKARCVDSSDYLRCAR